MGKNESAFLSFGPSPMRNPPAVGPHVSNQLNYLHMGQELRQDFPAFD